MDRRDIARRFIGGPGLERHLYVDKAIDELRDSSGSLLMWGLLRAQLFPELVVDIEELTDLTPQRLFVRMTVCTTPRPGAATWPAAVIMTFDEDDRVIHVWAVQDSAGWLEAAGILTDAELETRSEEASARLVTDLDDETAAARMFDGGFFRKDAQGGSRLAQGNTEE